MAKGMSAYPLGQRARLVEFNIREVVMRTLGWVEEGMDWGCSPTFFKPCARAQPVAPAP